MVNKSGWIRVVEASIAITIILGVLIAINVTKKEINTSDLSERIPSLLEKIASNESLREMIIGTSGDSSEVEKYLEDFLKMDIQNPNLNYSIKICEISSFCPLQPYPNEEVFAGERIISSSLTNIAPKKIKLFIWAKN